MAACHRPFARLAVGAHLVRDALALVSFKAGAFVLLRRASYFLFAWPKRKITKEKGHPASALSGHPARKVRVRSTGFVDRASCPDAKLSGIPAGHPAGFPSPARRCRGAPVEQRAIVARTLQKSQSNCQVNGETTTGARLRSCAFAFQLHHRVRARMARCFTRGPCAALSRGRQAAQRESAGSRLLFVSTGMCCRKARPRLTDLPGRMPGKRQAGWPSLWLLSLGHARESNSPSEGGRKLFALKTTKASRLKSLLQMQSGASRRKSLPRVRKPC
jgi:hypothetical protein